MHKNRCLDRDPETCTSKVLETLEGEMGTGLKNLTLTGRFGNQQEPPSDKTSTHGI